MMALGWGCDLWAWGVDHSVKWIRMEKNSWEWDGSEAVTVPSHL